MHKKEGKHIPSEFSMSTISPFKIIGNKHDVSRDKTCMKKVCKYFREHAMKIINLKKKKMELLTKQQQKSYEKAKICVICQEIFEKKYVKDKKYYKVRDHCHYSGQYRDFVHIICNLKYSVPKNIPIAFHNGSNYDYHFIIKRISRRT